MVGFRYRVKYFIHFILTYDILQETHDAPHPHGAATGSRLPSHRHGQEPVSVGAARELRVLHQKR